MNRSLFVSDKIKRPYLQFGLYVLAILGLGAIFFAYYAPDLMIDIGNQIWALCGK